jgi:hypothetical protein
LNDAAASAKAVMRCRRLAGPPWLDRFPDAAFVLDEFDRVGHLEIGTRLTLITSAGVAVLRGCDLR